MTCADPHPAPTADPTVLAALQRRFRKHGYALLNIHDRDAPHGWVATMGRTDRGQHELLIFVEAGEQYAVHNEFLLQLKDRDVQPEQVLIAPGGRMYVTRDVATDPELEAAVHQQLMGVIDRHYGRPVAVLLLHEAEIEFVTEPDCQPAERVAPGPA